MNTSEAEMQAAFRKMVDGPGQMQQLLQAFEVFVQGFISLKLDNQNDLKDFKSEMRRLFAEMKAKVDAIVKGKDGYTPQAGIDYHSKDEMLKILEDMRPKMPEAGVDYHVPSIEEVMAEVMKEMQPTDVFKALFAAPENIIIAINQADNQIKADRIEGLEKFIIELQKKASQPMFGSVPASLTPIAWKTPTETPNGVTTVFTITGGRPTDVTADGIIYFSGNGYTYSNNQLTFTIPPSQYVKYR